MGWLYVPASKESDWALPEQYPDTARSVWLRGKPIAPRSWSRVRKTARSLRFLSGMTLPPSTADAGVESWISSTLGFRASPGVVQGSSLEPPTNAGSGATSTESSAKSSLPSYSLRKSLGLFEEEVLVTSYPTLPKQGSMRSGVVSPRQKSAPRTAGNGCSSSDIWNTPEAHERTFSPRTLTSKGHYPLANQVDNWPTPQANKITKNSEDPKRMKENGHQTALADAVHLWPTPQAHDERERGNTEADHHHKRDAELWATPNVPNGGRTSNTTNYREDGSKQQIDLNAQTQLWATPASRDEDKWHNRGPESGHQQNLSGQVYLHSLPAQATGKPGPQSSKDGLTLHPHWPTPGAIGGNQNGTMEETGGRGNPFRGTEFGKKRLNPMFVEWLMGFPRGWTVLVRSGMQSYRHRQSMRLELCGSGF